MGAISHFIHTNFILRETKREFAISLMLKKGPYSHELFGTGEEDDRGYEHRDVPAPWSIVRSLSCHLILVYKI